MKANKTETEYLLLSYVPLLMPEADLIGKFNHMNDSNDKLYINSVLASVPEVPYADACIWMIGNNGPFPVFVMENCAAIVEHLKLWAEDKVTDWFSCSIVDNENGYGISLFPDFNRSIERFKIRCQLRNGYPFPSDQKIKLIAKPLAFRSKNRSSFDKIKPSITTKINVGFIDSTHVDQFNMAAIDFSNIIELGPFNVNSDKTARDWTLDILTEDNAAN